MNDITSDFFDLCLYLLDTHYALLDADEIEQFYRENEEEPHRKILIHNEEDSREKVVERIEFVMEMADRLSQDPDLIYRIPYKGDQSSLKVYYQKFLECGPHLAHEYGEPVTLQSEKDLEIYFVNFSLRPMSKELILKNVSEANAKCYTVATDADEAIHRVREGLNTLPDWDMGSLKRIVSLTLSDLDHKVHNQSHIIQAITDARVVIDLEMWVDD